jgi:hypothetical protein
VSYEARFMRKQGSNNFTNAKILPRLKIVALHFATPTGKPRVAGTRTIVVPWVNPDVVPQRAIDEFHHLVAVDKARRAEDLEGQIRRLKAAAAKQS